MMVMWSDAITAVEDPASSKVSGKVGYTMNPTKAAGGKPASAFGGWGFFVNARSKSPREAALFVQWCNRPSVQIAWAKVGGIPASKAVFDSPEVSSLPQVATNRRALEYAVGWSTEPYSERMIEVGRNALAKAVARTATPQQAVDEMRNSLRAIAAETGGGR